ncbi:MAG: Fic family protein [Cyanobacteria bacterium P01_D01_bin.156]
MTWIYEHPDWPTFNWDSSLLSAKLADIRYRQGWLLGRMTNLGFDLQQETSLKVLTNEVVKSSAIEGAVLNPDVVRSSIAQRLGIDIGGLLPTSRDVDGIVEVMLDATQNYDVPLTRERLFGWHAALFPTGWSGMHEITVGGWRPESAGAMQIISGPISRETIHFEAPIAARVEAEMSIFLAWFKEEQAIDPILKAGLAHLWFVTIHPFEDGNGRIARAIADMALARADNLAERFYSMSAQIELERKEYYTQLERQQRGTVDVTGWLDWFLDCLGRALASANETLAHVLYKTELWNYANRQPVNERQQLILNRMLENFKGHMTTSKYAKLAKCSTDTALRDIQDFVARGVFIRNSGGGRSTSYRLATNEEISR